MTQRPDQGAGLPTRRALREQERAHQQAVPVPTRRGRHALDPAALPVLTRREIRQLERAQHESTADSSRLQPQSDIASPQKESVVDGDQAEPAPILLSPPADAPLVPSWQATVMHADVTGSHSSTPRLRVSRPLTASARATGPATGRFARRAPRLRAVIALSFSALLVAGTSLSATNPSLSFASSPPVAEFEPQELLTVAAAPGQPISRDGYSVTAAEVIAEKKAAVAGYRTANTFTNNPTSAIQWPFPVGVPISDGFGPRESPGGIGSTNHKGVDFTPGQGTPVNAVAAGVVRLVQETDQGGLGVYVVIDHVIDGVSVSSWYGHMLTGSPVVTEGQVVVPGQQLGNVGNTGVSTGAHTHLEIHVENTPVDPYAWISARN